ncbi:hypothetical protein [Halopiger xanaduensis]|uniref:Uncharacterized protein n=1 Tax=Halopiger xanaduensis (strain DSM 18323 / JCM 14033 / SH-6) TaxID=797210 RepID=F8D377_HALXS|nr:hypothetical protein [Halopiger xanaduensis]AEH38509.1 hypothetical protein Halxa_3904 [Halopiger xanaduensis SH-6]
MAMDRIDAAALVGFALVAASALAFDLDQLVVATGVAGFLLSLAVWRLYGGRVWEALGWLAWVGAAGTLAFGFSGAVSMTAFLGFGLVGAFLLIGGRSGYLRDVWRVESPAREG